MTDWLIYFAKTQAGTFCTALQSEATVFSKANHPVNHFGRDCMICRAASDQTVIAVNSGTADTPRISDK